MSIIPNLTALTVEDVKDWEVLAVEPPSLAHTGDRSEGGGNNATSAATQQRSVAVFPIEVRKHLTPQNPELLASRRYNLSAQARIAYDGPELLTADGSKSTVAAQETAPSAKETAGSAIPSSASGIGTNSSLPGKTDLADANDQASSQQLDFTDKSTEGGIHVEKFDATSPTES